MAWELAAFLVAFSWLAGCLTTATSVRLWGGGWVRQSPVA